MVCVKGNQSEKFIAEWAEDEKGIIAYYLPLSKESIGNVFCVHVRSNQQAYIFCNNKVLTRLKPGIYTITKKWLTDLLGDLKENDECYSIYFLKTQYFLGQPWSVSTGTPLLELPEHEIISSFGSFDVCVNDPKRLIESIHRRKDHFTLRQLFNNIEDILEGLLPHAFQQTFRGRKIKPGDNNYELAQYIQECVNIALYRSGFLLRNMRVMLTFRSRLRMEEQTYISKCL